MIIINVLCTWVFSSLLMVILNFQPASLYIIFRLAYRILPSILIFLLQARIFSKHFTKFNLTTTDYYLFELNILSLVGIGILTKNSIDFGYLIDVSFMIGFYTAFIVIKNKIDQKTKKD